MWRNIFLFRSIIRILLLLLIGFIISREGLLVKSADVGKQFEFNWYSRRAALDLGGIRLIQLGTVCCEPNYQITPHKQWCYEISYFVSGQGTFVTDERCEPICADQVFITPLGCTHSILVAPNEPLHFSYIGFEFSDDCSDAELTKLRAFFEDNTRQSISGSQDLLLAFYRAVGELSNAETFSPMLLTGYVQSILIMSMRLFSATQANPHLTLNPTSSSNEIIYSIMKSIDDHLTNIQSISALARDLGYHPCYLSHHFKQKTGMTLQEYIARKKIEQAIGLMRFSPLTLTQIAERMGFATLQSFSRSFKRITGQSPSIFYQQIKHNTGGEPIKWKNSVDLSIV